MGFFSGSTTLQVPLGWVNCKLQYIVVEWIWSNDPFANGSELRSFKILFKLILLFCRIFWGVLFTDVRRKLTQIIKTYTCIYFARERF